MRFKCPCSSEQFCTSYPILSSHYLNLWSSWSQDYFYSLHLLSRDLKKNFFFTNWKKSFNGSSITKKIKVVIWTSYKPILKFLLSFSPQYYNHGYLHEFSKIFILSLWVKCFPWNIHHPNSSAYLQIWAHPSNAL